MYPRDIGNSWTIFFPESTPNPYLYNSVSQETHWTEVELIAGWCIKQANPDDDPSYFNVLTGEATFDRNEAERSSPTTTNPTSDSNVSWFETFLVQTNSEKYKDIFVSNGATTFETLRVLNDHDLESLGFKTGSRLRILKYIQVAAATAPTSMSHQTSQSQPVQSSHSRSRSRSDVVQNVVQNVHNNHNHDTITQINMELDSDNAKFLKSLSQRVNHFLNVTLQLTTEKNPQLIISGSIDEVQVVHMCFQMLLRHRSTRHIHFDLEQLNRHKHVTTFNIPQNFVGFLLGKGGTKLRQIEDKWGMFMIFDANIYEGMRTLYIVGNSSSARHDAVEDVQIQIKVKEELDNEKNSHASTSRPTSRRPQQVNYCYNFQKGSCQNGDSCRFAHVARSTSGDWTCANCSANNFIHRHDCYKCATPRNDVVSHGSSSNSSSNSSSSNNTNQNRDHCLDFQKGRCTRGTECRYRHVMMPQEQIDKYNDTKKKDLPCYKFQSGQCRFGDECHFSHTIESRDSMQQRGADSRPGDWGCMKCGGNNFSRRNNCFKCQEPRPRSNDNNSSNNTNRSSYMSNNFNNDDGRGRGRYGRDGDPNLFNSNNADNSMNYGGDRYNEPRYDQRNNVDQRFNQSIRYRSRSRSRSRNRGRN